MRRLIPIFIFTFAFVGVFLYLNQEPEIKVVDVPEISFDEVVEVVEVKDDTLTGVDPIDPEEVELVEETPVRASSQFNLAIPWTSQAPNAVWDARDQDACEEASIYMVHLFFEGVGSGLIDSDIADVAIQDLVDGEMKMFGYFESTTAEQTAELIESYYGYSTELIEDPTVEQIKEAILTGHPVVVPVAGQMLANPYFTPPGPEYHMLVVKGFTENGFITNDPGTRHGENWLYEYDHLMNSIHDWNEDDILSGKKVVIVIQP